MREVLDAEQEFLTARVNLVVAQRDRVVTSYAVAQAAGRLTLEALAGINLNSSEDQVFPAGGGSARLETAPIATRADVDKQGKSGCDRSCSTLVEGWRLRTNGR